MKVEMAFSNGTTVVCHGIVESGVVMCGGEWWPGVVVVGPVDAFALETVECAINEGGVLFDTWEHEFEDEPGLVAFRVLQAHYDELAITRRLAAKMAVGAVLQMSGGRCLTVTETGAFTDGEREFSKLGDALH